MKTLGLIGGLSWYSTIVYYRTINQLTNERLGGANSAKLLLYSVNFQEFTTIQEANDWDQLEIMITDIALLLERSGVDVIMLCTNTPHLVADLVRKKLKIPLLHIAEETAKAINRQGIKKVGLMGTKFTMEHTFFKDKLSEAGIQTLIPEAADRDFIHAAVFNELTKGIFADATKQKFLEIINGLRADGAEGVIFGCTEFSLLVQPSECDLMIFETVAIHSRSAVDFALS